ncbi:MAG: hypothetical protein LBM69_07165 [Lachnospiraceae bacterium]|jgi:hypothetical protein|nr:hypothetical protein [Lachnospiraceae bacterium]
MKYGVRKPNFKRSIKARTTGKITRQMKSAVNPLYGKKGMGVINDPKKAAYNAVYSRTTVGVSDVVRNLSKHDSFPASAQVPAAPLKKQYSDRTYKISGFLLISLGIVLALLGLLLLIVAPIGGVASVFGGVAAVLIGRKYRKFVKGRSASNVDK